MARTCQRCQHQNEDHAKFCLSCGAMLEVEAVNAADPLIGKVLVGRYRPIRLLGEGGMGRVYLAEQKMGAATRRVAIKTLHPELSQDPQLVARFHRESETVIELNHPNTIQFYDFGELEDGTLFIVMEYIEGRSLASEMEHARIDLPRVDKILIQICNSLHEAHGRGIVHRDLKPDNVLLTDRGGQTDFVKVLDFGIAKKDEADDPQKQKLTKQGMVLGTPPYMSPEQFSGKLLDARSDIYSLGVMVYEMLAGVLPFEAKTPWEWATKHLTAQPMPFEAHPQTAMLPPNKKNAVMRALAKDREQRHPTVLDFLQEFTGLQDAQAAWTMATSSGGIRASAVTPAHTPGPMPQYLTPGAMPQHLTPGAMPQHLTPGGMAHATPGPMPSTQAVGAGAYPSGSYSPHPAMGQPQAPEYPYPPPPRSSVRMALFALVGFMLAVGGGGAIAYQLTQQPIVTENDPQADPNHRNPEDPRQQGSNNGANHTNGQNSQNNGGTTVATTTSELDAGTAPQQTTETAAATHPVTSATTSDEEPDAGAARGPDERDEPDQPERHQGPSAQDEARARAAIQNGQQAIQRNDFRASIAFLRQAHRLVGRRSSIVRPLEGELDRRGANQIIAYLQAGRCPLAQQLYRDLRTIGATQGGRFFDPSWCPRP